MSTATHHGKRATRNISPPVPPLSHLIGSLSKQVSNFLHRSSVKEAHIPRRLHPNSKQRRNVTGPPKPSFFAGNVSKRILVPPMAENLR